MKVISLFSGGGLGDYGLELAGMEIVFQVEIDSYCQKILKLRWPNVPKWKDITTLKADDLPECDLIAGGFPCQDISVAGKGEGITGKRSGLWSEMFRIIRAVRPRYVLVENVTALLGRGLDVVLGDLASCGYDCEWDCIPASAIGAPHQRDRIWIVAYAQGQRANRESKNIRKADGRSGRTLPGKSKRTGKMANPKNPIGRKNSQAQGGWTQEQPGGRTRRASSGINWWTIEPAVDRVVDECPNRIHRLRCLGNGQVVFVVEWIGRRIIDFDNSP